MDLWIMLVHYDSSSILMMFNRQDITLVDSTLNDWLKASCNLMKIVECLL